ncbi:Protein of unknown function (DUF3105) [Synechococcus sp. PCC 7502]|uniref:DUF3105 domain-containing protein n=1 Tax=Synechococcus sp. PCC 7502 TaxID=1173263 RepID=UPI00029F884F|nr:DUF3105 domain-containing protein [Synechococcus sp. PCC 7502]AFY73579.1 Protein of unknown function (DUF3105) [Synechococcus sp. PCC 7502]
MNKSNKILRKRPSHFWEKVREHIWLVFPFGIVAIVVILAIVNNKPQIFEPFEITTQGNPLPPLKAGVILAGKTFPNLGQKHIPEGERVTYNSNPPTSGSHYQIPAAWGIYSSNPPVDERLVHNLEHGGIIISYNPDLIKTEDLEKVKAQARELRAVNPRLIVVPRTSIDTAIALTAWGYLQKLQGYDSQAIKTFYDAHIARSPECQNGLCPI